MKKLLSILICVVLGVSSVMAASHTVNLYAKTKGKEGYVGGKVWVQPGNAKQTALWVEYEWGSWTSNGVTATATGINEETGWIKGAAKAKVKVSNVVTGYYFDNWYTNETCTTPAGISNETEFKLPSSPTTHNYYAYFKEQTVYKNYANAVAILVDNSGKPFSYGTPGDYTVKVGEEAPGKTCTYNASKPLKTIDNDQGGSWSYTYTAACSDGYDFVGWFEADDDGNLPTTTNGVVGQPENDNKTYTKSSYSTNILYTNRANAPEAKTMYAVFRPKLHLFSYKQAEDEFAVDPMSPNSVTV